MFVLTALSGPQSHLSSEVVVRHREGRPNQVALLMHLQVRPLKIQRQSSVSGVRVKHTRFRVVCLQSIQVPHDTDKGIFAR